MPVYEDRSHEELRLEDYKLQDVVLMKEWNGLNVMDLYDLNGELLDAKRESNLRSDIRKLVNTATAAWLPSTLMLDTELKKTKHLKTVYSSKSAPQPPGPYSWPILGNAIRSGSNTRFTLANLAKIYSSLFSVRLGSQLLVIAVSQEAETEILKTQDRILSGRFVPDVTQPNS
ncbi:hypothetical protein SADUNF_Sadunf03G0154000 [Salix dunnii]|uniref:Uncharacterized protein n=1 Tax=Salix dunnii TaxID=1413687 RepID=A0A835N509_9ROSI|nr:hypothetical protein SADUNF_Sadunf03G0154000 [Salix dunnii]